MRLPVRRLFCLTACGLMAASSQLFCGVAAADTLSVAVAANVQYAFSELQSSFEKHSVHRLQPIFGSSGKLVTQITLGAPFDVFLSADSAYPAALQQAGFTAAAPVVYARGALVLWTLKAIDLSQWQATLASAAVRRIALPNPDIAPYGREALRAIAAAGLTARLQPKLVIAESVSQANQYIHSQAVDAGFTARSVVQSEAMRGVGNWVAISADLYHPIAQAMVTTTHGARLHAQAAQQFSAFLLSPPAREILARNGYLAP